MLGEFQHGDCVLARDGRKLVQKLIQGVAPFQVVDEALDRRARSSEDGSATEPIRVACDEWVWQRRHESQSKEAP